MARFLATGQEVQREIRRLFSKERGRRVAMVAFVGKHAAAYLGPRPKGIELICWPLPGSTNAGALRELIRNGVDVKFARYLHMKVYWTRSLGAVVSSANLTSNALGAGDLHEAGVWVPSRAIKIDTLIASVGAKPVDDTSLRRLTLRASAVAARQGGPGKKGLPTFLDWLGTARRKPWILFLYVPDDIGASRRIRRAAKKEFGVAEPAELACTPRDGLQRGDQALTCYVARGRLVVDGWMFVHRVVLVEPTDRTYKRDAPFQAAQMLPTAACAAPPFVVDSPLRRACQAAFKELGEGPFEQRLPSARLLRVLELHYRREARR